MDGLECRLRKGHRPCSGDGACYGGGGLSLGADKVVHGKVVGGRRGEDSPQLAGNVVVVVVVGVVSESEALGTQPVASLPLTAATDAAVRNRLTEIAFRQRTSQLLSTETTKSEMSGLGLDIRKLHEPF